MSLDSDLMRDAQARLETILDWLRWSTSQLALSEVYFGHGTDNPWDEAIALTFPQLGLPFDTPETLFNARLTDREKHELLISLEQRINHRKPVSYITNQAFFCGMPFYIDERVLVPRSPMAELIEDNFSAFIEPGKVHSILDLCTGSGCIAIATSHYFPEAVVTATDISQDALEVAEINAAQHQVGERLCLLRSDVFESLPELTFDLIVSNPPYVDAEDMADLPEEYRQEPELGLSSGNDGLDLTRRILMDAHKYLSEHGILVVEVGNSWPALEDAFPQIEFQWVEFERGGDGVFVLTKHQLEILAGNFQTN